MKEYEIDRVVTHTVNVTAENREKAKEKAEQQVWNWINAEQELNIVDETEVNQ